MAWLDYGRAAVASRGDAFGVRMLRYGRDDVLSPAPDAEAPASLNGDQKGAAIELLARHRVATRDRARNGTIVERVRGRAEGAVRRQRQRGPVLRRQRDGELDGGAGLRVGRTRAETDRQGAQHPPKNSRVHGAGSPCLIRRCRLRGLRARFRLQAAVVRARRDVDVVRGRRKRAAPEDLEHVDTMVTLMRQGWGRGNPAFRHLWSSPFLPGGSAEQVRSFNELQRITALAENAVRIRQAMDEVDVSGLLARVKAPTLVIHCRGDAVSPFE